MLGERYDVEEVLGEGGHATVFRVRNRRLGRTEALKVLKSGQREDRAFVERFLHEARLAASLEHPNIATVYDSGEAGGGTLWYTLRLVDGETLARRVTRLGPLDGTDVARLAVPLLDALAYSHARGVVHRDVKPDNVLVDAEGSPHLVDFGIAKSPLSLTLTQTGQLMGTPAFISPEQARGRLVDGRSDLYSLGVTLYFLLSGRYPFEASEGLQAVVQRLIDPPMPLSAAVPGVDPVLEAIVMTALAVDADDRFPSALGMKGAMEALLRGEPGPLLPRPAGGLPPAAAQAAGAAQALGSTRPTPLRIALFAALLVVLAGAAATAIFLQGRPASPPPPHPGLGPSAPTLDLSPSPAAPPSRPVGAEKPPLRAAGAVPRNEGQRTAAPLPVAIVPPRRIPGDDVAPAGLPETCAGETVDLSLAVGADGSTRSLKVISKGRPECAPFALRVASAWRFVPATDADGKPVDSRPFAAAIQF